MSKKTPQQRYDSKRQGLFSRIARLLTHRMPIVSVLIILQLALLVVMVGWFSTYFVQFLAACFTFSSAAASSPSAAAGEWRSWGS